MGSFLKSPGLIRLRTAAALIAALSLVVGVLPQPAAAIECFEDCQGPPPPTGHGPTRTTGTVVVVTQVTNDDTGTAIPNDFFATVVGNDVTLNTSNGNAGGIAVVVPAGDYQVTATGPAGYVTDFDIFCNGVIAVGDYVTCTITNDDEHIGGAAPAEPPGRVLSDEGAGGSMCTLTEPEAASVTAHVEDILRETGATRDVALEARVMALLAKVVAADTTPEVRAAILNFIVYGTRSTTGLGAGERAGMVDSYRAAFGHLPTEDCDWQDIVRMSNGRLPIARNAEREHAAHELFVRVYRRAPDHDNVFDQSAIYYIAYGLRSGIRNLSTEWSAAVAIFGARFGTMPATATDWNIIRAIAYSGAEIH